MGVMDELNKLSQDQQQSFIKSLNGDQLKKLQEKIAEEKVFKQSQIDAQKEKMSQKSLLSLTASNIDMPDINLPSKDVMDANKSLAIQGLKALGREAVNIYLQFGAGMVDTIDDLGRLMGVEIAEDKPEPSTKTQEVSRFVGSFFSPSIPGTGPGMKLAATQAKNLPAVVAKVQRVKNFLKPIAQATKKNVGTVGEILSSIPKDLYEKAVKNPEILNRPFKGKETYRQIGMKAQKAVNFLQENAAKLVKKETDVLANKTDLLDVGDYYNFLDDAMKQFKFGEVTAIKPSGKKLINQIENELLELALKEGADGKASPATLHGVKRLIDEMVTFDPETVKRIGPNANTVLQKVRNKINVDLRQKYADYALANDYAEEVFRLRDAVKMRLKDRNLATSMKSVITAEDTYEKELLERLDEIIPENMSELKFIDDLKIARVNEAFRELFAGQGGGSGSAQGMANFFRLQNIVKAGSAALRTAGFGVTSPMIHKQLIKRSPAASKFGKTVLQKGMRSYPGRRTLPVSLIKAGRQVQRGLEEQEALENLSRGAE